MSIRDRRGFQHLLRVTSLSRLLQSGCRLTPSGHFKVSCFTATFRLPASSKSSIAICVRVCAQFLQGVHFPLTSRSTPTMTVFDLKSLTKSAK